MLVVLRDARYARSSAGGKSPLNYPSRECINMPGTCSNRGSFVACAFAAALAALFSTSASAQAPSGEPIKIGFGMAATGPLAANGKMSLVAMKIWEEDVNAKGGLLGRPVKLIYYDDQSNPGTV